MTTFDPYDYRHLRDIIQSPVITILAQRSLLKEAREQNEALHASVLELQAELDILRASQGNQRLPAKTEP